MATRQVYATSAAATAGGWSYNGPLVTAGVGYGGAATSLTSWWGEKPVQMGAKLTAVGASTTELLAAINQVEWHISGKATSASPEDPGYSRV